MTAFPGILSKWHWGDPWPRRIDKTSPLEITRILLGALVTVMIIGGVALRLRAIATPPYFTFDEELFVNNAHAYLVGLPDANDHPPLGKLIMAVGMLVFGDDPLGWRFASLCFGLQTLVIGYWLGGALFGRTGALLSAAFLACDGFFIAYSRTGLLDGMLTCLVLWSVLLAVSAESYRGILAAAVMVGLAASIKWSGAMAAFPAVAAVLLLRRVPRTSLWCFIAAPVVHVLLWMGGLKLTGLPADPLSLAKTMLALLEHHLELGNHDNAAASHWYSWLYLYHPIVVKLSYHGAKQRYASSLGNPWLWAWTTLSALSVPLLSAGLTLWSRWRPRVRRILMGRFASGAAILWIGWLSLLLPWMIARGKYTFSYHYMPSYGFGLVLLGGSVAVLFERHRRLALGFLAIATLVSGYFAPVWGEFPLTERQANQRLLVETWRP